MSAEVNPHRFEFDLDSAITAQVLEKLDLSPFLQLTKNIGPNESGIYALYYKNEIVYVGKASKETTKSKRSLRARLNEHVSKIEKRRKIELREITCRYLTFASEWWLFAAEFSLISRIQPEWNYSGFGSKIPGKGRPGTDRVSDWDSRFPAR